MNTWKEERETHTEKCRELYYLLWRIFECLEKVGKKYH
jgi:hypothetical protein